MLPCRRQPPPMPPLFRFSPYVFADGATLAPRCYFRYAMLLWRERAVPPITPPLRRFIFDSAIFR
jgi:hypothetical protein